MNLGDELIRLQQAEEKEDRAIKLLVLQLLHLNGIIAVDASESVLDREVEQAIAPAPKSEDNWN